MIPIPGPNNPKKIYNAGGDLELRATRRPIFNNWLNTGVEVAEKKFILNKHAYNSLFKSGRKDIMPDDVLDALSTSPIKGEPGSVIYINPMTGTKVFVNPDYQEIVGIHPNSFK